jgi:hypothetical protein
LCTCSVISGVALFGRPSRWINFKAGRATFQLGSPFLNCWKWRRKVPHKLLWTWNELNVLLQRIFNHMILSFIHVKGCRQHSCFRQLYKTNYLIEWRAASHGCLWQTYQLRGKILLILPSMVEAEKFLDHPRMHDYFSYSIHFI